MMVVPGRVVLSACLLLCLSACGEGSSGGEQAGARSGAFRPPAWRLKERPGGWTSMTLRFQDPGFVRFRVTGSNDGEHT